MKLHTDHLTTAELWAALRYAGLDDVHVGAITRGSRSRLRGYEFRLAAAPNAGRRRRNTGQWGAEYAGQPAFEHAATWDEHGRWFAVLFDWDSEAKIGRYDGREDFHRQTYNAYVPPRRGPAGAMMRPYNLNNNRYDSEAL